MLYLEKQDAYPPLFEAVGCVCILDGKILLLKRVLGKSYPGYWGIPSGKIQHKESPLRAMVRELFEETGILLSADNLRLANTYHIVTKELSFLYTVYVCQLKAPPPIKINKEEHTRFAWFSPDDALRLELITDLDGCLRDIFPSLNQTNLQLDLFTGRPRWITRSTQLLEQSATSLPEFASSIRPSKRNVIVSLGPPGAGKTAVFKEMIKDDPTLTLVYDNTALRRSTNLNMYLRKAFQEDQRAFFFHFQMESLLLRFKYTLEAPDKSLVDESIYTTLAYSRALYRLKWLKEYEYQIFYNYYVFCFSLLPQPETIFYIDSNVETLKKRLRRRSRKHESFYSDEYIDAMRFAFSEVAAELSKNYGFNIVSIDSSNLSVREIVSQYVPQNTS